MDPLERQIAPSIEGIRRDHVERYKFAASHIPEGAWVIDVGCGVGYGSWLLAEKPGRIVKAIDIDPEAIEYAHDNYYAPNIHFEENDLSKLELKYTGYQYAVCFEMIEHVDDPLQGLKALAESVDTLIASVPNESVFPWKPGYIYHKRHYTAQQFEELLNEAGFEVDEWYGQHDGELTPDVQAKHAIVVAHKTDKPRGDTWKLLPKAVPLVPSSVAIVAMGPSNGQYFQYAANAGGARTAMWDQTWAINAMGGLMHHDILFHMDDCKVQEARAPNNPQVALMVQWLKNHPKFFTSKVYDDYPGAVEYPIGEVLNTIHRPYLSSTCSHALALAIHMGIPNIWLYGMDFNYDGVKRVESGRGSVEWLVGFAEGRGHNVSVPATTSLFDVIQPNHKKLYGYDAYDIEFTPNGGGYDLTLEDAEIPSPEEIEKRYGTERLTTD